MNVSNVGTRPSNVGTPPAASNWPRRSARSCASPFWRSQSVALGGLGDQNDTGCPRTARLRRRPTGTWTLTEPAAIPAFAAPLQPTYVRPAGRAGAATVVPMTSSDWCSAVAVNAQGLSAFVFPHDTLLVFGHRFHRSPTAATARYQAVIHTAGQGEIDLSASCLQRFGVAVTCDALAAELTDYAARPLDVPPASPARTAPTSQASCAYYYTYSAIQCADNGNQGCACRYGVDFAGTFTGRWSAAGRIGALRREEDVADAGRLLRGRRWQHALVVGARSDVVVRRARFANAEAAKDALICQ